MHPLQPRWPPWGVGGCGEAEGGGVRDEAGMVFALLASLCGMGSLLACNGPLAVPQFPWALHPSLDGDGDFGRDSWTEAASAGTHWLMPLVA